MKTLTYEMNIIKMKNDLSSLLKENENNEAMNGNLQCGHLDCQERIVKPVFLMGRCRTCRDNRFFIYIHYCMVVWGKDGIVCRGIGLRDVWWWQMLLQWYWPHFLVYI